MKIHNKNKAHVFITKYTNESTSKETSVVSIGSVE